MFSISSSIISGIHRGDGDSRYGNYIIYIRNIMLKKVIIFVTEFHQYYYY